MSNPTFVPVFTGDPNDDDAFYIDDLVKQQAGPIDPAASAALVVDREKQPEKPNRLLTGFSTFSVTIDPSMLLNVDLHRMNLLVSVYSATPTDAIYVADDPAKLAAVNGGSGLAYRINTAASPYTLSGYTGALWFVIPTGITGPINVSWASVTK